MKKVGGSNENRIGFLYRLVIDKFENGGYYI